MLHVRQIQAIVNHCQLQVANQNKVLHRWPDDDIACLGNIDKKLKERAAKTLALVFDVQSPFLVVPGRTLNLFGEQC